jgi:hypothetical protein
MNLELLSGNACWRFFFSPEAAKARRKKKQFSMKLPEKRNNFFGARTSCTPVT